MSIVLWVLSFFQTGPWPTASRSCLCVTALWLQKHLKSDLWLKFKAVTMVTVETIRNRTHGKCRHLVISQHNSVGAISDYYVIVTLEWLQWFVSSQWISHKYLQVSKKMSNNSKNKFEQKNAFLANENLCSVTCKTLFSLENFLTL